ncbi:MAG: ATP-grasp domain-containing protein [Actinomycetota bacterium]|nr:ATP-grasp domain-containing protein [Actinomycetota bacterium]
MPLGYNHNYIYEGADTREILSSFDPLVFIEYVIKKIKHEKIDAVIGTHDYPASIMASIIANMIGLDGVNVPANFLCQHKYYSREMQSRLFGPMVPEYKLLDPFQKEDPPYGFPFFLKPVKSFFSILACRIENTNQFLKYMEASRTQIQEFVEPFNRMLRKYTLLPVSAGYIMAEKICTGQQVTLEGYVYEGQVFFIGITDSIMYKGTQSFKRFDYPSSIDSAVQQRMMDVSRVWLSHLNYGNGLFNIEFFYNRRNKSISIIEMNPRMCSQFADLVEKVDGINTYRLQLDLSLGKKPDYSFNRKGKFASLLPVLCSGSFQT